MVFVPERPVVIQAEERMPKEAGFSEASNSDFVQVIFLLPQNGECPTHLRQMIQVSK
jgi:hypothetical protein